MSGRKTHDSNYEKQQYHKFLIAEGREIMKLYLLTTRGLGDFYLVSRNPNEAELKLKGLLDEADYGFSEKRKVENIKLLAEELDSFPKGKPFFSSGNNFILPTSCDGGN